jgi:hypothetical protein
MTRLCGLPVCAGAEVPAPDMFLEGQVEGESQRVGHIQCPLGFELAR